MHSVEYFVDAGGEWRYRVVGRNGEIMVTSEGYTSSSDARRGLADLATELLIHGVLNGSLRLATKVEHA